MTVTKKKNLNIGYRDVVCSAASDLEEMEKLKKKKYNIAIN